MDQSRPLTYGVLRARELHDDCDMHLEEIDFLGYTVLPDAVDEALLAQLRDRIDCCYEEQAGGHAADLGAETDLLRCPLAFDDIFLRVATTPVLLDLATRALGQAFVLMQQNAIINRPNRPQHQSCWHRDLPYQHFVSSRRLAINALLCVDDFTSETGGTLALPGSHKFEEFPSARFVRTHKRVVAAKAGSMIVMDSMLFHRAGANISPGTRRGLNHLIGIPLMAQQIDIPRVLGSRFANDPFLGGYLGYRWNPAADIGEWRDRRA